MTSDGSKQFVSHPNTRTLHYGTLQEGANCGQVTQVGWAEVDADNQLDAVLNYGTQPCSKCFTYAYHDLKRVYLKEHTAVKCHYSLEEAIESLPWSVDTAKDRTPDA